MPKIIELVENYIKKIITKPNILLHHLKTRDYLLILNPNASIEAQIAALTHDIERSFPNYVSHPKEFNDKDYLLKHGEASARIVNDYLQKEKQKVDYDKLEKLIAYHEIGGVGEESDQLRDADSLSFLEVMPVIFIEKHGNEKSREKFEYMYSRIGIKKARSLAKPLYEKAVRLLN